MSDIEASDGGLRAACRGPCVYAMWLEYIVHHSK
jgi:hypothetical protein